MTEYAPVRALTFDVGGTLDSPGVAWRPRFERLYREVGVLVAGAEERFARAFYDADDHLHERHALAGKDLAATVRHQVDDVLANLGVTDDDLAARVTARFVAESRASFAASTRLLRRLATTYRLGVISNYYGNVDDVLRHEGLRDLFQVIVDSTQAGIAKPARALFEAAAVGLGVRAEEIVHVGDSYPRDVEGALAAGMRAVWLAPDTKERPRDPRVVKIHSLDELEGALERLARPASPPVRTSFGGVLAAGTGTRFSAAGIRTPKALVPVGGRALLLRTLDAFSEAGFDSVAVVANDATAPALRAHVDAAGVDLEVHWTVATTASTLETFCLLLDLAAATGERRFAFTTVDAVTASGELRAFVDRAESDPAALVLGIAPVAPGDDSPLRVALDAQGLATVGGEGAHATAGYYAGDVALVRMAARAALREGVPSLRAFLTRAPALLDVRGIVLGTAIDVDTPEDVVAAERALARWAGGVKP